MIELIEKLGINNPSLIQITQKVYLINSDNQKYILKELNKFQRDTYYTLLYKKVNILKFIKEFEFENKIYHLYPYFEEEPITEKRISKFLQTIDDLHQKTQIMIDPSKFEKFRLKRLIVIINDKYNSLEYKFRTVEMNEYKDDNSWIILSNYHTILKSKKVVYNLLRKIIKVVDSTKELKYVLLHSCPTLDHFKGDKLLSFPYSRYGYYVNDFYKIYINIEHLDLDLKSIFMPYLKDDFAIKYLVLMVLYSYIIDFDNINFDSSFGINKYLWYTKKISKLISIFKENL